jgi:L-aminopeptidase/D-esterase-like protein
MAWPDPLTRFTPRLTVTLACNFTHQTVDNPATVTPIELAQIGALAAETVAMAVCRAVLKAKGLPEHPATMICLAPQRGWF